MKKFTNLPNYRKFICSILEWDIVKIGVLRIKVEFRERISKGRLTNNFFYMRAGR